VKYDESNANGESIMDSTNGRPSAEKLWIYLVLPAVILNLGAFFTYGAYYALYYTQPGLVAGISPGAVRAATDILIFVVEWAFAISIILRYRREGLPLMRLIAPKGNPTHFHWRPALLLFAGWNLLFVLYMLILNKMYSSATDIYQGLSFGIRLIQIILVPITAASCEELIWRGYIPTQMEMRGYRFWPIVLLSSLSFALIHGIFLVDKIIVTFLLGILSTVYYLKERNLAPLIITHWFVDLWSFGWFMFLS